MTTRPSEQTESEKPWHLRGNLAPVSDEIEAFDLPVEGAIPPELSGLYLRNGPNPVTGVSPHWFFGNGMIHGVRLERGRAAWYRNRYVKTPLLEQPDRPLVSGDGSIDRRNSSANTHVIAHAGKILALEEGHFPYWLTRELSTVGYWDFDGRLATAMTAHPKICPVTGEMLFFGYDFRPPYLTYHRVDADGKLAQSEPIAVPGPTMMHDWNVTRNHVVFMDLPVIFDLELAMRGTMPYRWSDEYGARLGVMPRHGSSEDVVWYEVEPCYVFHPMNAYEDGETIVIDVARFPSMWRKDSNDFDSATLHRWTIDRARGRVSEQPLDDRPAEFARVADRVVGLRHRFGYMMKTGRGAPGDGGFGSGLLKYDLESGRSWSHDFGPGRSGGEGVFAASAPGAGEDEGWLLTYVYDAARNASDLVILDAHDFEKPPVATVRLPRRVPAGFHGSWIPDPR
jgi:carotenoid cleavage dioxygenase